MKVYAPETGFSGKVAGQKFEDGVADVDKDAASALQYFRRHGYGIGSKPKPVEEPEPPDPRKLGDGRVGTPLRDAAVDPKPEDFLPPINAGKANPHGPDVVSPELHASQGVRPVKGGEVHVDDTRRQDAAERAHAVEVLNNGPAAAEAQAAGELEAPAKSANKPEWVDFAVAKGLPRDEAEAATKADLQKRYGGDT